MGFTSRFHIIALDTTAAPPKPRKESVQLEPSKHFPVPQDILDAEKSVPAPQGVPPVNAYIPVPREIPRVREDTETEAACKPPWAIIKRGAKSPKQPRSAAVSPEISPEKKDIPIPPANDTAKESIPKPTAVPAVNEGTEPSARLPWSIRKRTAKQPKQSQSVTVPPEVESAKESVPEPRKVPPGKENVSESREVPSVKEETEASAQLPWFKFKRAAKPSQDPQSATVPPEPDTAKGSVPVPRDAPLEKERVREISPAWDSLSLPKEVWLTDETDTPAPVHWFRFKRAAKPPKEPKSATDHPPDIELNKQSVPAYQENSSLKVETGTDTEKVPDTYRTWTGTENQDRSPGHRRRRAARFAWPALRFVHPLIPI